jgi:uncharacterized protein
VHAGIAFLEKTTELMARHRNLWANLESTFSFIMTKPRVFAEILGELLLAAGADRLMFGSGVNLIHTYPPIKRFCEFEMPSEFVEDRGYPELTIDIKRKILGGNALRLHGLDAEELRCVTAGDDVERRRERGLAPRWSRLRNDPVRMHS